MRGVKRYSWLLVLAMMILVVSTVQAQSSRIAFSSDREDPDPPILERHIWKMKDEGEIPPEPPAVQMTDPPGQDFEAHNPTIAQNGYKVFYDWVDTELWMADFNAPGNEVQILNNARHPDSMTLPNYPLGGGRERILFTTEVTSGTVDHYQVWMAIVDIDDKTLEGPAVVMTPVGNKDNTQPAFCGDNHFVWALEDSYGGAICYQEFDNDGPVGTRECRFYNDEPAIIDLYPSCDPDGDYIGWAREIPPVFSGELQIFKISVTDFLKDPEDPEDPFDPDDAVQLTDEPDTVAIMPTWSPSGSQIAYASTRSPTATSSDDDYEIWAMNQNGSGHTPLTDNSIDDREPNWGPAALP